MVDDAPLAPEQVAASLPGLLARARVVVTPYPFSVSGADSLRVTSANSVPGVVIEVHGRCAVPGFDAVPFRFTHVPNSDRTKRTEDFNVGPGYVTNLTVFATGATPKLNQTYVIIQLVRSAGATAFLMGSLVSGPVTTTQPLGWPGSPLVSSLEGRGNIRGVIGTNPGPGIDILEFVPTGARWRLIGFAGTLATTAAAVTRVPFGIFTVDGGFGMFAQAAAPVLASASAYVQWLGGYSPPIVSSAIATAASLAGLNSLPGGSAIGTFTENLQAGDDWSAPLLYVEEWLEVA